MGQFKVGRSKSVDGRDLIKVRFTRQSPDSDEPSIDVTFQFVFPESFCLSAANPGVLALLSTIRTDTHEPVVLTEEERQLAYSAASEYAAELAKD